MLTKSLRKDVLECDNMDLIGYARLNENRKLQIFYNPNWETQGPRYFLIVDVDNDGYVDDSSKHCRILEDKPEYLMGVDGKDSKLTKKEKELLIDFFNKGGDVRRYGGINSTGWEAYIAAHNNDKQAGCFTEVSEEDKYIGDTIDTKPMPNYNLLETED